MQNENTNENIADKINEFVQRNRKGIFIILGLFVVIFAGIIIYLSVSDSSQKKAIAGIEELGMKYSEIKAEAEEEIIDGEVVEASEEAKEKKEAELDALLEDLNKFAKGKRGYAAGKAWSMIGQIYSGREDWAAAETAFLNVDKAAPKTYLAPISLFNAAAAAEEQGKIETAIEYLQRCVSHKFTFPAVPRAQFSIGRLYEQLGDFDAASTAYRAILTNWPNIEVWANLAQSRIIAIETR
jgi:tetratricopeptide (TPR) repeat protein